MSELPERVDTLIVGSGYGGAVLAARLAASREVVVVERGRRYAARELPDNLFDLARAYERPGRGGLGLWGLRLGKDVGNAYASAYGGGSVLNYGITARPDAHVFERWPISSEELAPYFERAESVLQPTANPRADALGDKAFLDRMEPGRREDLRNTIDWSLCTECGNCVLGCRHDAKRSLDRTYLQLAEAAGARMLTDTTVTAVEPVDGGGYHVWLRPTGLGLGTGRVDGTQGATRCFARELVLSAGTFGTLDLLLALRPRLPLSPRLGERMSMNGDALALLYDVGVSVGGASGAPLSTAARTHFVGDDGRTRTLTIMSGRVPKAMMAVSGIAMAGLAEVLGGVRLPVVHEPVTASALGFWRRARDVLGPSDAGALARTFLFKLDGEDEARGVLGLDGHGRAVMDYEGYGNDPILRFASEKLQSWAQTLGVRRFRDLGTWPGMRHFGVHPLGGATMGRGFFEGVVDDVGRVWKPQGGHYEGLRIMDASVLPTALGVPPSWTIAAVAERAADSMLARA